MGENVVIVYFLNLDYAEEDEEDEFKGPHSQKVGHLFFLALKGRNIPAQGKALGTIKKIFKYCKGAT
jgi:hypothetical protein